MRAGILRVMPVLCMLLLPVCGCVPASAPDGGVARPGDGGLLSLFLNLRQGRVPDLEMRVRAIEIRSDSGAWLPLARREIILRAGGIGDSRIFVARAALGQGHYSRLRLTLSAAALHEGKSSRPLTLQTRVSELAIQDPVFIGRGDSRSLFLSWDVQASLADNGTMRPVLALAPRLKNLIADVAYVACPDIDTVYMIRTDRNWVYDSLGVAGGPAYLFRSPLAAAESLYALTPGDMGVKRIAAAANRVVETYRLSMAGRVTHMALGARGRHAYIVDRRRGNILRLDLRSGIVDRRARLGYGPVYVLYLEKMNLLAVSLSLSQSVVLVDPETLATIRTISTADRPEGLAVWRDSLLYIAEAGSSTVLQYDLERGRAGRRIPVGFSPRRILALDEAIYVADYGSASLSVLRPGQLGIARKITLAGRPLELADVEGRKLIYVGSEEEQAIAIVDPVTMKAVGRIPLGTRPAGITVMQ